MGREGHGKLWPSMQQDFLAERVLFGMGELKYSTQHAVNLVLLYYFS